MKKLLLTFLAATASLLPLLAQDYAPFRLGRTPYFQAGDSIYSLRITNVFVQGGDSVFEFNPRAVEHNSTLLSGCNGFSTGQPVFIKTGNNVFGERMVKTASGDFVFKFTLGDSMVLRPNAPLNQVWVFSGPHQLNAMVTNKGVYQVQGLSDSVVTISLGNGHNIRISKNYGLIESRSFYDYRQAVSNPAVLHLKALEGAPIGQPVSSPFDVFDFQPGDKFLYQLSQEGGNMMTPCYSGFATMEVLSRTDYLNGDSIVYQIKRQLLTTNTGYCSGYPAGTVLSPFETSSFSVNPLELEFLNSLSQEYIPFGIVSSLGMRYGPFNTGQFVSDYNGRIGTEFQMKTLDTCAEYYTYPMFPGSYLHRKFAAGLGQVFYNYYNFYGGEGIDIKSTLIAYIKGAETYGNWAPLVLSRESELSEQPLQVYPNPFSSELTLQLPNLQVAPAEILLHDMLGRTVHHQQLQVPETQQQATLFLPELPAGLYLLQLKQAGRSYTAKVQRQ